MALKGFKAFLMRGNVIDLAVAVVIGAAFTSVVNSLVKGVINPVVGAFGTKDLSSYRSCLSGPCAVDSTGAVTKGIYILWGDVVSAALQFLITAAVVYFLIVLPMNRLLARFSKPKPEPEPVVAEVTEVELLSEIRDLLNRPEVLARPRTAPDSENTTPATPAS